AVINLLVGVVELPLQITLADRTRLIDPPIRLLMAVYPGSITREDQPLRFEPSCFACRVESAVSEDELARQRQEPGHIARRILIGFRQVEAVARKRVGIQIDGEFPIVGSAKGKTALARVVRTDVSRDGIGKREVDVHSKILILSSLVFPAANRIRERGFLHKIEAISQQGSKFH